MILSTSFMSYSLVALITIVLAMLAWLIVLQVRLGRMTRQYKQLVTGTDGKNLENMLNQHIDEVRTHVETVADLVDHTRKIDLTLKHCMQWMGLIRFNPFRDTGGNQSFAWTIVDGYGNGIVLSSLHSREGTRAYAKPLNRWESPYSLTDEEQQAIDRAHQQQG
ncbi:MAG: DUF4446 family protein [Anaerolineae bacterium]|nr:DUF4446 family protein [Anaerolineae bacterium]